MSAIGAKRSKAIPETEALEPAIVYENERDWREYQARRLRTLWRLRRVPLGVFAVSAVISIIAPFLIPNSYVAKTQLMPPDNNSISSMAILGSLASKAGPLAGMASDLLNVKTSAGLFIGVLTSQNVQGHLVRQFELKKIYKVRDEELAQAKLNDNTLIREDKNSGIIAISVTDHDPQRAAAIANAYVAELNSLVAQLSTSSARTERIFLEERLKLVKQDLDNATNQLAQYSSSTATLDPQQEGKAMLDAAGNITAQLIAAQSQLEGLRQIYTDRHPRVRAMNARVMELRKQLQKLGGVPETTIAQTAPNASATNDQSSNLAYPSIRSLPLLGAKYSDYYRHMKIQETVYELLTGQYELAKVQEAKEIPTIKVLDVAMPPLKKASPPRLLLISLGLLLSFGVATAMWFLAMLWQEMDRLDPRLIVASNILKQVRRQLPWKSNGNADSRFDHEEIGSTLRSLPVRQTDESED